VICTAKPKCRNYRNSYTRTSSCFEKKYRWLIHTYC